MTDETPLIHKQDDLEKPFSRTEAIKLLVLCCLLPWIVYAPILLLAAAIRTYPSFPPLWTGFWFTEITLTVCYLIVILLLWNHPRIIRIRMQKIVPNESDPVPEQEFARLGMAIAIPGLLFIPYDAVSRAETFPIHLNMIGSVCVLFSMIWITIVFRQNKFASRVVFKQEGRQLIKTGLYSIVRHPMYLGVLPLFVGFSLCLGSYWGLLPMMLLNLLTAYRTFSEEEFLVETFGEDYLKYRDEVKYRIVPFIF